MLFKSKPDYNPFKVFGCACYHLLHPYDKHKLDFWSTCYLFLGYSLHNKRYICLTTSSKTIISRHVIFNEDNFSFSKSTNPFYKHSDKFVEVIDNNVPLMFLQRSNCDFVHTTTVSDIDQTNYECNSDNTLINNMYFENY